MVPFGGDWGGVGGILLQRLSTFLPLNYESLVNDTTAKVASLLFIVSGSMNHVLVCGFWGQHR